MPLSLNQNQKLDQNLNHQKWKLSSFSWLIILAILAGEGLTPAVALDEQGKALLAWRDELHWSSSSGRSILSRWSSGDSTPCDWPGIGCNAAGIVVSVNLTSANLTGTIPSSVGALTNLVELDLSQNGLSGEIPAEIFGLGKLQRLFLNTNFLEGSISDSIGNLTELKLITLYDNKLAGEIPSSIGRLKNLEAIRAGGNKNLVGAIPEEIGNCSKLVVVGFAETGVSGKIPRTIGMLKKLETLALYTALLSGPIPNEIGECSELRELYLYENSLTGSIPASIRRLKKLQSLLLWQNSLVGTLPPEIGECSDLEVLDVSINAISGKIPLEIGNLTFLRGLQLSVNKFSGEIPTEIGRLRSLEDFEIDNNEITGTIPSVIGELSSLTQLLLWKNRIEGNIPKELGNCRNLEGLDLSQNALTGAIPEEIFELKYLTGIMILSNNISGEIPKSIGNCSALIRFRAGSNKLAGEIPPEIGNLKALSFIDLGSNRITGEIPNEISGCQNLTYLNLRSNSLSGTLPIGLKSLSSLEYLDLSDNSISGDISPVLGPLTKLTKLNLSKNQFSGSISSEDNLASCKKLQLLDLSSNDLSGEIPTSLGKIPSLEISLNLSSNFLTGPLPEQFTNLDRLGTLDLSRNQLSGDLHVIAAMQNLVTLNISENNFSGTIPQTPFFHSLPISTLAGNPNLLISGALNHRAGTKLRHTAAAMIALLCTAATLLLAALYIVITRRQIPGPHTEPENDDNDNDLSPPWEVTLYQKLDISIADVASSLKPENVIGRGRTGVVYRVTTQSGNSVAVKRFIKPSEKYSAAAFAAEIGVLAGVRHRNVVRLLGFGANRRTKLLFYAYMPNGDLASLLYGGGCAGLVEWRTRLRIARGVAEGLAYLHHDCVPAILHRDVKAHNILIGDTRDVACLADFGLARLVQADQLNASFSANPHIAGSYGYIAPEYASMQNITTKSDVYSFGVVLLELITGKRPIDPSFPEGQHVVQWVRDHLKLKKDPVEVIDPKLQGHTEFEIEEMLQALGISLLCVGPNPKDRPTMKDVAVLLREVDQEPAFSGSDISQKSGVKKSETAGKKIGVATTFATPNSSAVDENAINPTQLLLLQSSCRSLPYSSTG